MPSTGATAGRVGGGSSPELGLSRNGKLAFILKKSRYVFLFFPFTVLKMLDQFN